MNKVSYLLDTHALVFWSLRVSISKEFVVFLDRLDSKANLLVSTISFWEIALLVKKSKIELEDVGSWSNELINSTNIQVISPTFNEMIESTLLPELHKDPFDRLLISQAISHHSKMVTKDDQIRKYEVSTFWM